MQGPVKTKPPRSGPPHLSRSFAKLMARLATKSGAMDPRLAGNWEEIVGPDLAKLCRPVQTRPVGRARALEVAVANGAAAMQVQYKQDFLLQKINAFLGRNNISRIMIRQTGKAGLRSGRSGYSKVEHVDDEDAFAPERGVPSEELTSALDRMKSLLGAKRS